MKKYSYGRIVQMSWDKTAEILFKPFNFKKWLMLGVIIFLAGQIGGFNFNITGDKERLNKMAGEITKQMPPSSSEVITPPSEGPIETMRSMPIFSDPKKAVLVILIVGTVMLLFGLLLFLWMWVNANFSFVFIESVVRNDASLRVPFHRNKPQGNSYLMWNILFSSIAILILCAILIPPVAQIVKSGMLSGRAPFDITKVFSIMIPYVPAFLISVFLFILIALMVLDFILPIMYGRKTGILKAWAEFLGILLRNLADLLLYLLIKLALAISAILITIAILIVGVILLLLAGGIAWLIGWLIYLVIPAAAKATALIVLIIIGFCIMMFLVVLFSLAFLPIPVFFRIFPIYVLASMDESLDLFAAAAEEKMIKEDVEPYKKSMALVWFTALSPLIIAILALIAAVAIPYFARALVKEPFNINQIESPAIKPIAEPAKKAADLKDELVTVYLRNGNSFKAKIERESDYNVSFAIDGGTFTLPRSDILRIE